MYIYYSISQKAILLQSSDPHNRKTVMDLVRIKGRRIFPVGRLDKDTTGLLLLTDDGDFAYALTHPKHGVKKTYEVIVSGNLSAQKIQRLQQGVYIDSYKTAGAYVKVLKRSRTHQKVIIKIHEGKKRQVRRMFLAVGCTVRDLKRTKYANLTLAGVGEGAYRFLNQEEVQKIKG